MNLLVRDRRTRSATPRPSFSGHCRPRSTFYPDTDGALPWSKCAIRYVSLRNAHAKALFPLRGGQRIMVACGCSRLRGDLRRRRPGGHAASARARAGVVRTGCGSGPLPTAGKADRPLEPLEPRSDALRPVRRRKLEEGQGGADAGRACCPVHPAPGALDRRVRPHSRRTENRASRVATCFGQFGRASGGRNLRGHYGRRCGACRLGVRQCP